MTLVTLELQLGAMEPDDRGGTQTGVILWRITDCVLKFGLRVLNNSYATGDTMVETRGTRGGRRGRAPRGRGRRGGRTTPVESEIRIPVPEDEGGAEIPVQQPITVDRAGLLEMMRELVREIAVTPQADSGSAPVVPPVFAPVV